MASLRPGIAVSGVGIWVLCRARKENMARSMAPGFCFVQGTRPPLSSRAGNRQEETS